MNDKEQAAIDALRAAGLEAEAIAVERLRATHRATMDAYHAGQRHSYKSGQAEERERCASICASNSEAKQRIYESTEDDHDRGASLMADWLARAIGGRA